MRLILSYTLSLFGFMEISRCSWQLPSEGKAYFENNLNVQEVEDTLRNAILRVDVS